MSEEKTQKKRPWYMVRRVIGLTLGGMGALAIMVPGAPVVFTVGAIGVTTTMIGTGVSLIATHVFAYGQGAADERVKK